MIKFDIETNGLLPTLTEVFTICLQQDDGPIERYHEDPEIRPRSGDIEHGLARLRSDGIIIAHGAHDFDVPALQKVYPLWRPFGEVRCSLVDSRLIWSDIKQIDFAKFKMKQFPGALCGSHAIEAWGHRMNCHKGSFDVTDSSRKFTQEESDYCAQDVAVLSKLVSLESRQNTSPQALRLERSFAIQIADMRQRGVTMDQKAMNKLSLQLELRIDEIRALLAQSFPDFVDVYFTPVKKLRREKVVPFNPNSGAHIQRALYEKYGWKPKVFCDDGSMKSDGDTLAGIDFPEMPLVIEFMGLRQLLGQISGGPKSWATLMVNGKVHPRVTHNGTPTGRCRHSSPNTNVRKVLTSKGEILQGAAGRFGYECRSCWVPEGDKVLVGADASGIEFRILAHLIHPYDKGALAEMVLQGIDIHQHNADMTGLTREAAKTALYASLYGAGAQNISQNLGVTVKEAGEIKKSILGAMRLDVLIKDLADYAESKGYIVGLDGRRIPVRSLHAVLNCANQGGAAVVVKQWTVDVAEAWNKRGFEFQMLIHQHDEMQVQEDPFYAEELANLMQDTIVTSGQKLNLNIPLAADAKIGTSWAQTH